MIDSSNATLYGKGIFSTIAIFGGRPFLWEKHWRRLAAGAETIGLDLSRHPEKQTRETLKRVIKENDLADGRVRVTFHDETQASIWSQDHERETSLSIVVGPVRPVSAQLKLTLSPYPINSRSPLAGVKSCNYLEAILSLEHAKRGGFDEAIRLNELDRLASACMANIFWLSGGKLHTPELASGCRAGTTREFILDNLTCYETSAGIDGLFAADAIFLTSAGIGIRQVTSFEKRDFEPTGHAILDLWPPKTQKR